MALGAQHSNGLKVIYKIENYEQNASLVVQEK